jgi:phosphopantetheine binding protein
MAVVDTVHEQLCQLLAEMMGDACGRQVTRPHLSFLALGGTDAQAAELARMVNALFALELPSDIIMRSPTPDALARTIETSWEGSVSDLIDLIEALADAA